MVVQEKTPRNVTIGSNGGSGEPKYSGHALAPLRLWSLRQLPLQQFL